MSVAPYPLQCKRDGKWSVIQSDELLPGDVVSISKYRVLIPIDEVLMIL